MRRYPLADWACCCSRQNLDLDLHPTFLGARSRSDAWSSRAWLTRSGHHVLLVVDQGYCDLGTAAQRQRYGPGACFIKHPQHAPPVQFSQRIRYHECYIKLIGRTAGPQLAQDFMAIEQAWDLIPAIDALAVYRQQDSSSLLLRYSVAQLLLRFDALYQEQRSGVHALSTAQCNKIIRWTRQHIELVPEPRDIAQLLDLSADYCSRVCRQRFGISLRDWLIRERIQEAARRLRERSDSIEAVGQSLGFSNAAHFSRQFKRHMHCTPRGWRQQI